MNDFDILPRWPGLLALCVCWFAFFLAGTALATQRFLHEKNLLGGREAILIAVFSVSWGITHLPTVISSLADTPIQAIGLAFAVISINLLPGLGRSLLDWAQRLALLLIAMALLVLDNHTLPLLIAAVPCTLVALKARGLQRYIPLGMALIFLAETIHSPIVSIIECLILGLAILWLWRVSGIQGMAHGFMIGGLIALPILIVMAGQLMLLAEQNFRDSLRQEAHLRLELVKSRLEGLNDHAFDLLKIAGSDSAVMAAFDKSVGTPPGTQDPSQDFALRILNRRIGADATFLINLKGDVIATSEPEIQGIDLSFRPYFIRALAGEANAYFARSLSQNYVASYFARPVLNENAETVGVLTLRFNLEKALADYLRADEVMLHRNGIILLGPEDRSRGRLFPSEEGISEVLGERLFTPDDLHHLGFTPQGPAWLKANDGQHWMWTSMPLPGGVWETGKLISTETLMRYRDNQIYLLIGLLAILLLLALHYCKSQALVHLLTRQIDARRSAELAERASRVEIEIANNNLVAERDRADAANRAKSDFLANMSHEIRTPMNGIIGMTDLALDADTEVERQEYMKIVKNSAESLLGILNDILDFSKIEANKLMLERLSFALRQTISETLKTLQPRASQKGLNLTCEIADDVPPHVIGDPTRLRQILINLVGNAIKFTPSGDIAVCLAVEARTDKTVTLQVAVRDSGIGIAADKLDSIFEAFSQADASTTRQYGGTGLGLSISNRLVELMGGQMSVDSEPGKGSTFQFTLPLGVAEDSSTAAKQGADSRPKSSNGLLDVLLVEDNPINQQLAIRLLQKWGHQVTLAVNGQEAVDRLCGGERYDVVLMDMQMPVMGGIDATRRIREHEAAHQLTRLPIVAMTANAMQGDREICLEAGMDDYLSKPINQLELSAKLQRFSPMA